MKRFSFILVYLIAFLPALSHAGTFGPYFPDISQTFNGSTTTYPGGGWGFGGVDDDNGLVAPTNSYAVPWTACTAGNDYCNTGTSTAFYMDTNTGVIWSRSMAASTWALDGSFGHMTWYQANNCSEDGSTSTTCTKRVISKTGCEANAGWYVPSQKQILQAYIDGAHNFVGATTSAVMFAWTGTTKSDTLTNAWYSDLTSGYENVSLKTLSPSTLTTFCARPWTQPMASSTAGVLWGGMMNAMLAWINGLVPLFQEIIGWLVGIGAVFFFGWFLIVAAGKLLR